MKKVVQSMAQGVLDGMRLPRAEGFMTALLLLLLPRLRFRFADR